MNLKSLVLFFMALGFLVTGTVPSGAQTQPVGSLFKRSASLELKETPLRKALAKLFEGTGATVVIDVNVPDPEITGKWTDQPFDTVFSAVIQKASKPQKRIMHAYGTDACFVMLNPNTPEEEKQFLGAKKKVTLTFKDVSLHRVVDMLFSGSGLQYAMDPLLAKIPVSLELKEVTIESALSRLQAAAPVTVTLEGNVYYLRRVG